MTKDSDFWLFLRPYRGREHHMNQAIDKLEEFFSAQDTPVNKSPAEAVLGTMEKLVSDVSLVFDTPFTSWSRDCYINKTWDLTCQYSRINRYQKFNILLWKYNPEKPGENPTDVLLIERWVEWLPEKN